MSDTTDEAVSSAAAARLRELVAGAVMAVHGLPNAVAWQQIPSALSLDPAVAPWTLNERRALVWEVRTKVAKHLKKNPGLSEAEIHAAMVEIAGTVILQRVTG